MTSQALPTPSPDERVGTLLAALGLDRGSVLTFLEWALSEQLVQELAAGADLERHFKRPDGLKAFRDYARHRTGRRWTDEDLGALYERVRTQLSRNYRDPIPYGEVLKLLWQVPFECVVCHKKPPEIKLHIDHIVPASKGGRSVRDNLQLLCAPHNLAKSNKREVQPWLGLR